MHTALAKSLLDKYLNRPARKEQGLEVFFQLRVDSEEVIRGGLSSKSFKTVVSAVAVLSAMVAREESLDRYLPLLEQVYTGTNQKEVKGDMTLLLARLYA